MTSSGTSSGTRDTEPCPAHARPHLGRALCSLAVVLAASAAGCTGQASAGAPASADETASEDAPVVRTPEVLPLPRANTLRPPSLGLLPAKRAEPAAKQAEPAAKRAQSLTSLPPTCVTLAATQDTDISDGTGSDGPSTSHGAAQTATVGNFSGGERDMLLQFDLSAIPPFSTITSATLTLAAWKATGPGTVNAFFVTSPWTGSTTWNSFGGAFSTPAAESFPNGGPFATTTVISTDLSAMAQAWIDGTQANDGILFSEDEDSSVTTFWTSREPGEAPSLVVCYGPAPTPGAALVCAGGTSSSQSYTMVSTLGQSPGGNVVSSGTTYVLHGGLVGVTQAGP
jgi:hypothetical protein